MIGVEDDDKAFIFTLKNPHEVEPTRFMKRKKCPLAICCNPEWGPTFGNILNFDIGIWGDCNIESNCFIDNCAAKAYECHPQYKSSLFVNTDGPKEKNFFSVLDLEVYTFDN